MMYCTMESSTRGIWAEENGQRCSTQSMRAVRGWPWLSQVATHVCLSTEPAAVKPGLLNTSPVGKRRLGLLAVLELRVVGREGRGG